MLSMFMYSIREMRRPCNDLEWDAYEVSSKGYIRAIIYKGVGNDANTK